MSLTVDIRKGLSQFDLEVSFEVGSETLGFLGASGCGKSMTLRCIAGVETPDEGRIVLNGRVLYDSAAKIDLSPQERKTALLFQNYQLFPNMTVEQNIAAGIDLRTPADERRAKVARQVERFALEGLERRFPLHLSGGQQQRVALARMLAAQPGILMLDEPFSALDAHLKSQLETDLQELFETFDGPILYVSHDIDEAFRFCDRIAVVDQGHVCEIGPTEQIVNHPRSLEGLRLSGCKNIAPAVRIGAHTVRAPEWGVELQTTDPVPDDVAYVGYRASFLQRIDDPAAFAGARENLIPCTVEHVSDSRFVRVTIVRPQGVPDAAPLQWKVDKLAVPASQLPEKGDTLTLYMQPDRIYLVAAAR